MASIMEDNSVNYDEQPISVFGEYIHQQRTCNESITGYTDIGTGGQTMTFTLLGNTVTNLSECYLEFDISQTACGAGTYPWLMGASIPFFKSVNIQPSSGSNVNINNFHHYTKMVLPYLTPLDEFQSYDSSNMFFPCRTTTNLNKLPANGFDGAIPYLEPQYAICINPNNTNTAATYHVRLPFSLMFKGSFLSLNKSIKIGMDVQIQFVWEDKSRWIWAGTSNTSPNTGAVAVTAAGASNTTISGLYVQMAVEQNLSNIMKANAMYEKGYEIYVDMPWNLVTQSISASTTQNINPPPIGPAFGVRIKTVFAAPFNATETLNTSLDHCNQTASPVVDQSTNKVIKYQTMIDGMPRQPIYINASPLPQGGNYTITNNSLGGSGSTDWDRYRRKFLGSCVYTSGFLGLNYVIIDDYTAWASREQKHITYDNPIDGSPCTSNRLWQLLNQTSSVALNWYIYAITQRKMTVAPNIFILA